MDKLEVLRAALAGIGEGDSFAPLDNGVVVGGLAERTLHSWVAVGMLACGLLTAALLLLPTNLKAPYGRYSAAKGWGVPLDPKVCWIFMESPNVYISAGCFFVAGEAAATGSVANRALLGMLIVHYINRSFIYPFRMKGGKKMPVSVMLMAFSFCVLNGYLQARQLCSFAVYGEEWVRDPRFIVGALVYFVGMYINLQADDILRNLRKPGETGYKIPRGGMFEYVSGANFFGEIVEWSGYAIASWSLPGVAFAVFTACNIGPRAVEHHKWYLTKFKGEYPAGRKAVIPFLF